MSRQSSSTSSTFVASRRSILEAAVSPLFEGLENRSHFSATPTANPGGPYNVNEGGTILISGLASSDTDGTIAAYRWDTNYDAGKGFKNRISTAKWTFNAAASGPRTVALQVVDSSGDVSAIQTVTVNVADVAPTLTLTGPTTAAEGSPVTLSWTATDPGLNDAVNSYDVDWGDGAVTSYTNGLGTGTHTYAEDGSYDVILTAHQTDADTSVHHALTITDSAPIVAATTPRSTIDEGEMVQVDFLTTNRVGTLDSWTINWGDGTTDSLDSSRSHAAHFYTDSGTYAAVISGQEPDGGRGSQTINFTVNNVAPEAAITGVPPTGVEGTAITVGSTVTDAGQDDTQTYGWSVYKDGALFTPPGNPVTSGTGFTFTPTDNGSYKVRLTVTDDEGGQVTVNSDAIIVANVNPSATISGTPGSSINEGALVSLTAVGTDAGAADVAGLGYVWSVTRNGADYALPLGTVSNTAAFAFRPRDNGTYVASVLVTDKDAGTATVATTAITVLNVAPSPPSPARRRPRTKTPPSPSAAPSPTPAPTTRRPAPGASRSSSPAAPAC